jgi:hypothetical protein
MRSDDAGSRGNALTWIKQAAAGGSIADEILFQAIFLRGAGFPGYRPAVSLRCGIFPLSIFLQFNAGAAENATRKTSLQLTLRPSKVARILVQHLTAQLEFVR